MKSGYNGQGLALCSDPSWVSYHGNPNPLNQLNHHLNHHLNPTHLPFMSVPTPTTPPTTTSPMTYTGSSNNSGKSRLPSRVCPCSNHRNSH